MQSTIEKHEHNLVSLELTAQPEEVEEALSQAYKKVVKKVSLPGFRKGRVPRGILESHFGKEVLYEEAIEILVSRGYYEAVREHQLEPVDEPKLEVTQGFEDQKPFIFKFEIEVLPEVKLGEYKGLGIKKEVVETTDEDVEKEIHSLQERHAELVVVEKESLEGGDFAVIDFEGYIDGTAFPGGVAQGYTLEIGSNSFIPGFEDGLIGMAPGSEKEVAATFPEDYYNKDLAGKEAVFRVKLHEIKNKELPAVDDEFAKSLRLGETVEELRENIRESLHEYTSQAAQREFEGQVIEKVVEGCTVEISETLIKKEQERLTRDFEHDLSHRGLKLEQYLEAVNQTQEQFLEGLRPEAEMRVKTNLVLSSIAKTEGIQATEGEINEQVERTLQYYPENEREKLRQRMNSASVREGISNSLMMEKTVRFLAEENALTPVDSTKDDKGKREGKKEIEKQDEVIEE